MEIRLAPSDPPYFEHPAVFDRCGLDSEKDRQGRKMIRMCIGIGRGRGRGVRRIRTGPSLKVLTGRAYQDYRKSMSQTRAAEDPRRSYLGRRSDLGIDRVKAAYLQSQAVGSGAEINGRPSCRVADLLHGRQQQSNQCVIVPVAQGQYGIDRGHTHVRSTIGRCRPQIDIHSGRRLANFLHRRKQQANLTSSSPPPVFRFRSTCGPG